MFFVRDNIIEGLFSAILYNPRRGIIVQYWSGNLPKRLFSFCLFPGMNRKVKVIDLQYNIRIGLYYEYLVMLSSLHFQIMYQQIDTKYQHIFDLQQ